MRTDLIKASELHFKAHIEKHRVNVEILLEKGVGVAEHPDVMETIEKELEITTLQDELRKFQTKKFGVGGDLFRKRKELIQPIQRKVFKAIQSLAKDNNYAYVLDKSKNSNILYADPKYDKSDAIIRKLKK